jgi:hypothetical protein
MLLSIFIHLGLTSASDEDNNNNKNNNNNIRTLLVSFLFILSSHQDPKLFRSRQERKSE